MVKQSKSITAEDIENFIESNKPIRPLKLLSEEDVHSLVKENIRENKLLIDLYDQLGISPSVLSHDTATSIYQRELYKHLYGKKSDNDD